MSRLVASALLLLALVSPAWAIPVEMDGAPLRDFVRWYSDTVGEPLAVDPQVSGELTVYAADVTLAELPEFFQGVLSAHGYTLLPGNPQRVTVAAPESFMSAINVPPPVPQATEVLSFDYVRASDIAPTIAAYLASAGGAVPQVLHASNALLVRGDEERIADLRQLLPQFDVASPQVLIQAVIFETTEGDTFDLGVALGKAQGADVVGGFNTNALGTALSVAGGSFGIFDGDVLALAVQALKRDSQAEILSTPQVLALSGRVGRISVGQNVPFVTGRVTGQAIDIDNPFQTIERRDVGVSLTVTPVVTAGGLVIMDVTTQADSLTDSMLASDIITNQRSITTTVQIRSGQSVLLGGLTSRELSDQVSSVPVLGDIPGLGALFRSTSQSEQARKLHVLLQATVLPLVGAPS